MNQNNGIKKVAVCFEDGRPVEYLYAVDADFLLEKYANKSDFGAYKIASAVRALAEESEKGGCETESVSVLRTLADVVEEYNGIPAFISTQAE